MYSNIHTLISIDNIQAFLEQGNATNTLDKYHGSIQRWYKYMDAQGHPPHRYFDWSGFNVEQQRFLLVHFVYDLHNKQHCSESVISGCLSALRHFRTVHGKDTDIFESEILRKARKAIQLSSRELSKKKELNKRHPITIPMLDWLKQHYWEPYQTVVSYTKNALDRMMVYVACIIGFIFMLRSSEYIRDKNTDHVLLSEDVYIILKSNSNRHQYLPSHDPRLIMITISEIHMIKITNRSSKCDSVGIGRELYLTGSNRRELEIMKVILKWCCVSSHNEGTQPFMCRKYNDKIKYLTSRMINDTLKEVAVIFGFKMGKGFSTHSLRIGGATELFRQGVDRERIKKLGGWSSDCDELYEVFLPEYGNVVSSNNINLHDSATVNHMILQSI